MLHTVLLHCREGLVVLLILSITLPLQTNALSNSKDETIENTSPSYGQSSYYGQGGYNNSSNNTSDSSSGESKQSEPSQGGYYNPDSSNSGSDSNNSSETSNRSGSNAQSSAGSHVPGESDSSSASYPSSMNDATPASAANTLSEYERALIEQESARVERVMAELNTGNSIPSDALGRLSVEDLDEYYDPSTQDYGSASVDTYYGNFYNNQGGQTSDPNFSSPDYLDQYIDPNSTAFAGVDYEPVYSWSTPSTADFGYRSMLTSASDSGVYVDTDRTVEGHQSGDLGDREVYDNSGNVVNVDEARSRYIAATDRAEIVSRSGSTQEALPTTETLEEVIQIVSTNQDTNDWWDFLAEAPNPNTDETYFSLLARKQGEIEPGQRLIRDDSGNYTIVDSGQQIPDTYLFRELVDVEGEESYAMRVLLGEQGAQGNLDENIRRLAEVLASENTPVAIQLARAYLNQEAWTEDMLTWIFGVTGVHLNLADAEGVTLAEQIAERAYQSQPHQDGVVAARVAELGGYESVSFQALEAIAHDLLTGEFGSVEVGGSNLVREFFEPLQQAGMFLANYAQDERRGSLTLAHVVESVPFVEVFDHLIGSPIQRNAPNTPAYYRPLTTAHQVAIPPADPRRNPPATVSTEDLLRWAEDDVPPPRVQYELTRNRENLVNPEQMVFDSTGRPLAVMGDYYEPFDFTDEEAVRTANENLIGEIQVIDRNDERALEYKVFTNTDREYIDQVQTYLRDYLEEDNFFSDQYRQIVDQDLREVITIGGNRFGDEEELTPLEYQTIQYDDGHGHTLTAEIIKPDREYTNEDHGGSFVTNTGQEVLVRTSCYDDCTGPAYIFIHGDETVSLPEAHRLAQLTGGKVVVVEQPGVHGHERNVDGLESLRSDPNRIFGAPEGTVERRLADYIMGEIKTNPVASVHTNYDNHGVTGTDALDVTDYPEYYRAPGADIDNFLLTQSREEFEYWSSLGTVNVALELGENDDSLSFACTESGCPSYTTIEVKDGATEEQARLMALVTERIAPGVDISREATPSRSITQPAGPAVTIELEAGSIERLAGAAIDAFDDTFARLDAIGERLDELKADAEGAEGGLNGNSEQAQLYQLALEEERSAYDALQAMLDEVEPQREKSDGEIEIAPADVTRIDYRNVIAEQAKVYETSLLIDQASQGLVNLTPECNCLTSSLNEAKSRPLDVDAEFKTFLEQTAIALRSRGVDVDTIQIFSGTHRDPRIDPERISDNSLKEAYLAGRVTADEVLRHYGVTSMASGNHSHGFGADPYFRDSNGNKITDPEVIIAIIETMMEIAGPNIGIGYSNTSRTITHVNLNTPEVRSSVAVWGYPGASKDNAPTWLKNAYYAAAARYADHTFDPNNPQYATAEIDRDQLSPSDRTQLAYFDTVATAAGIPSDSSGAQRAFEIVTQSTSLIEEYTRVQSPPAGTGEIEADRIAEQLAALGNELRSLAEEQAYDDHDHESPTSPGRPGSGSTRPSQTTGSGSGNIVRSVVSGVTDAFSGIVDLMTGNSRTGGNPAYTPDDNTSSDTNTDFSQNNQVGVRSGPNYQDVNSQPYLNTKQNTLTATSSRFFSTQTLSNLFNRLTGQQNSKDQRQNQIETLFSSNRNDSSYDTSQFGPDYIEIEQVVPQPEYIPVTVTVNEVSGEVTLSRDDLLESIHQYEEEVRPLPKLIPLSVSDPQNSSPDLQRQVSDKIDANIMSLPPVVGGVRRTIGYDGLDDYQKEIEPLQAYALLASETTNPPLLFNDAGEIVYSNGVYAPPIEGGVELYSSDDVPAYLYLIQYVNENGVVEVEANDDILPGNFFTNIINSVFGDNSPFSLNDVTEVTHELIDPRANVPRDEYYEYLIRLSDGSLRKVHIPEFSSVSFMREKFGEVGYQGNVLALIGASREIYSPRENDQNIVDRALDIAGNAFSKFTSIFGKKEQDTEEKATELPTFVKNQTWSIENIDHVYVYPEAAVKCPQVEGLYDGYVYKAVLKDHNNPNEAITITEARCGLGDPLTLINEIAFNLEKVYKISPLPIDRLTKKTLFNPNPIAYRVGVTKSPIITIAANPTAAAQTIPTPGNQDEEFIPNTTNTVSFAVKATDRLGNVLVDWTTNDLSISGDTQLHFRWDGSDYNQCLPFLNDGGRYSLTRNFDQTMRSGNTEAERYDILEASTEYRIECGGQNNGEFGVDRRVIEVSVN